jgi:pilus assembly protein CpaB
VVSAAADIKLGTILTAANLTTTQIAGPLPKGAILKPENAIGRGAVSDLAQGEAVLESRLAPAGSGGGLAATIRKGMRACAIKVDEVVGVAGFVTPGMRVDVLMSGDPSGPGNQEAGTVVKTLLQNIEVLSAGTDIEKDTEGKPQQVRVVNLLVTPDQAQVLSLAGSLNPGGNQSHIQLVLRNPLDTDVAQVAGTGMAKLFGTGTTNAKPQIVAMNHHPEKPLPPVYTVEVLNGLQRSIQNFPLPEGNK